MPSPARFVTPVFVERLRVANATKTCLGTGGVGGSAGGPPIYNGARGKVGIQGAFTFQELVFDGDSDDLDVTMAFAFPDQCQMLLNIANALFFQNTPLSIQSASQLYRRLLRRLSISPSLQTQSSVSPPPPKTGLAKSYELLEFVWNITISANDQLNSVYSQAQSFSNQIVSGNDMFGHDAEWVPRLNGTYYTDELGEILTTLQSVEEAYNAADEAQASTHDNNKSRQSTPAAVVTNAQDRIRLLTDDNGPLTCSADIVAQYTPLLKDKVQEVQANVLQVAADIQSSLNLDPQTIISALATLAIAPSIPMAFVSHHERKHTARPQ